MECFEAIRASNSVSSHSNADVCIGALEMWDQLINKWPLAKCPNQGLVIKTEYASWEKDLRDLGLERWEVFQRIETSRAKIGTYVLSVSRASEKMLKRALKLARDKTEELPKQRWIWSRQRMSSTQDIWVMP